MMDEEENKEVRVFGRNIAEIPCFRDSYFYGICTGIFGGFGYFMFTSRIRNATHFGMASFAISTLSYWTYCRMKYTKDEREAILLKEFLKDQILKEGVDDGVSQPVEV